MTLEHKPVLLAEAVKTLITKPDGVYIDATFGRGGHSQAILSALSAQGRLIAFDKDRQACEEAKVKFRHDSRFKMEHNSFAAMQEVVTREGLQGKIQGVLFDLGVSSPQLETPERGFSFMRDGPLDMRMDTRQALSAKAWLHDVAESDLSYILKTYGEERYARRISRAIVLARQAAPITTTLQLANIVSAAHPSWEVGQHPATKTFQAIRIHINNELSDLTQGLTQALEVLAVGGRLVVISFHSLEDRIVKRFIRDQIRGENVPKEIPIPHTHTARLKRISDLIRPSLKEINANPRARSAVMRVAEKIQ